MKPTSVPSNSGMTRFESLLLERGFLRQGDLAVARQRAAQGREPLTESLVTLGLVSEADAYATLAAAFDLGVVDLSSVTANELALRVVPERLARRHHIVPLSVDNRTLTYATPHPLSAEGERELACASGRRTQVMVASKSDVLAALERCYRRLHELQKLAALLDAERLAGDGADVSTDAAANGRTVIAAAAHGATTPVKAKPRVLVTDDERITRTLIRLVLERADFEVIEASNGLEAVRLVAQHRPDLVLMDLNMPGMNGYEAIDRLRKDPALATLPIVVLTAVEGPAVERRVLALGADDYLLKPFDADILVSRVRAVFRRQKLVAA